MSEEDRRELKELEKSLGNAFEISEIEGAVRISHNKSRSFLVEYDPPANEVRVVLMSSFEDQPDLEGEELLEAGREALRPEVKRYKARGYREEDAQGRPAMQSKDYDGKEIPVTVIHLVRELGKEEEIVDEVGWLVEQIPSR